MGMHFVNSVCRLCLTRQARAQHGSHFHLVLWKCKLSTFGCYSCISVEICKNVQAGLKRSCPCCSAPFHFMDSGTTEDPYCGGYRAVFPFRRPTISAMKPKPTFCGLSLIQAAQMTPCSWTKSNNFPSDMLEMKPSVAPFPAVTESF